MSLQKVHIEKLRTNFQDFLFWIFHIKEKKVAGNICFKTNI